MIYNYSTLIIYTCIRVLASLQASGLSKSPSASLECSSKEELFKQVKLLEKAIYYPRDLPDQSAKQQEEVLRAHKAVIKSTALFLNGFQRNITIFPFRNVQKYWDPTPLFNSVKVC